MKLANIVYEKELVNHTKVDYVNYINIATEYDELDKSLPTLYVGWLFMKTCNPNNEIIQNTNILERRIITNELYWECSFDENKGLHVKGVESFIKSIPEYYFKPRYKFINYDPVFFHVKDIEDLMNGLPTNIDVTYNYKNEMLYALVDNVIFGINLKMYEYFKFNIDDLLFRIAERTETGFLDEEGISYQRYYKILPEFKQLKRYIISILSK